MKSADTPAQKEPPPIRLSVRVTPRASSDAVLRYADGVLFLRLAAPPVEGAANAACCAFVAGLLGLRPSRVSVSHGHKGRDKVLAIVGTSEETLRLALQRAAPES